MTQATHPFERSILVHARPATVRAFLTTNERWARWWGKGSSIGARPGEPVVVVHQSGVVVRGELRTSKEHEVAFTWGYETAHPELPAGGSLVHVRFAAHQDGTMLSLRHDLPTAALRDAHAGGWRYHLAVLANLAADEEHHDAAERIDAWFAAWAADDEARRERALAACVTDDVEMRDAFACVTGREELSSHIAACHVHMPGVHLRRDGAVRHCQGTAVVDWTAVDDADKPRGRGVNVFTFAADGRIRSVVGLR
jgi:uncharacterized protein YndB with AHSA1/START domain